MRVVDAHGYGEGQTSEFASCDDVLATERLKVEEPSLRSIHDEEHDHWVSCMSQAHFSDQTKSEKEIPEEEAIGAYATEEKPNACELELFQPLASKPRKRKFFKSAKSERLGDFGS